MGLLDAVKEILVKEFKGGLVETGQDSVRIDLPTMRVSAVIDEDLPAIRVSIYSKVFLGQEEEWTISPYVIQLHREPVEPEDPSFDSDDWEDGEEPPEYIWRLQHLLENQDDY